MTRQRAADDQNQHDLVIARLALLWAKPDEYELATNAGGHENFQVGSGAVFPDIVAWVTRDGQRCPIWMVEVETADTVTEDQAQRQWAAYASAGVPFAVAVPAGSGDRAWTIAHGLDLVVERVLEYILDQSPIVVTEVPKFRISPREAMLTPPPDVDSMPLDADEERQIKLSASGCLVWLFIFLVVVFLTGYKSIGLLVATLATLLISGNMLKNQRAVKERAKAVEHKQRIAISNANAIKTVQVEADQLSAHATELYNGSLELITQASECLAAASASLTKADQEYAANAYGPFWDAVEQAAQDLDAYKQKIDPLRANAHAYYQLLAERSHTFPRFPARATWATQAAAPVAKEFQRVVRMGQTNFQFAQILEHRRTRTVLVAGFQSLGEAVDNVAATVESSAAELEEALTTAMWRYR